MTPSNAEIIRSGYDAFAAGDTFRRVTLSLTTDAQAREPPVPATSF